MARTLVVMGAKKAGRSRGTEYWDGLLRKARAADGGRRGLRTGAARPPPSPARAVPTRSSPAGPSAPREPSSSRGRGHPDRPSHAPWRPPVRMSLARARSAVARPSTAAAGLAAADDTLSRPVQGHPPRPGQFRRRDEGHRRPQPSRQKEDVPRPGQGGRRPEGRPPGRQGAPLERLVGELELILVQIANLKSETDLPGSRSSRPASGSRTSCSRSTCPRCAGPTRKTGRQASGQIGTGLENINKEIAP